MLFQPRQVPPPRTTKMPSPASTACLSSSIRSPEEGSNNGDSAMGSTSGDRPEAYRKSPPEWDSLPSSMTAEAATERKARPAAGLVLLGVALFLFIPLVLYLF